MEVLKNISVKEGQFLVTQGAKKCGVLNPVVCVIRNVHNKSKKSASYDQSIADLMKNIEKIKNEILPSEEVQAYRELYKEIDSDVTPAGERLLTSCMNKGFPRQYGDLVDAYNMVALETVSPFGMHDAKELLESEGPLIFKRAEGNEEIMPAFKKEKCTLPQGDFTYGVKKGEQFIPFAWLGQEDVDSKNHQLKKSTKAVLFTAIGNKHTSLERNMDLCKRVFNLLLLVHKEAVMEIYTPTFIDN